MFKVHLHPSSGESLFTQLEEKAEVSDQKSRFAVSGNHVNTRWGTALGCWTTGAGEMICAIHLFPPLHPKP